LCTPVAEDEDPEAVMVIEDAISMDMVIEEELESSPYWGEARTEVARAARRNVAVVESIFGGAVVCLFVCFLQRK
jgi:hypothetical protein